eukprot:CAMPEP_0183526292 /NCGR_PEP_ID=MMETSP0371-20130417/21233_1 /TAXON_ID=268820 /ORGANISM="Peridinium aciculiferum, Strain PAER-2" /LENGTH=53 /DNA_ID=CAMNT_0025725633 /DNA_START=137 /DNA_END=295 /DNA_ORIENTATION=+
MAISRFCLGDKAHEWACKSSPGRPHMWQHRGLNPDVRLFDALGNHRPTTKSNN